MLIAYYDLGNLDNPINKIHNKKGEPILAKNEIVILNENYAKCKIIKIKTKNTWKKFSSQTVFHDAGEGKLIRTDKRIIYIRIPQYEKFIGKKINDSELALNAKNWKRENKMECFSLPILEIKKIKRFKKAVRLYVEDDMNRYRLLILSENINTI